MKILILVPVLIVLAACTDSVGIPQSLRLEEPLADVCSIETAPCVVSVSEPATVGQPVAVKYTLCCPFGQVRMSILEVSGHGEGNWGDVTRWGLCQHTYVEEFVHPDRTSASPFAILSTFDGLGGDITECRTANAPAAR